LASRLFNLGRRGLGQRLGHRLDGHLRCQLGGGRLARLSLSGNRLRRDLCSRLNALRFHCLGATFCHSDFIASSRRGLLLPLAATSPAATAPAAPAAPLLTLFVKGLGGMQLLLGRLGNRLLRRRCHLLDTFLFIRELVLAGSVSGLLVGTIAGHGCNLLTLRSLAAA